MPGLRKGVVQGGGWSRGLWPLSVLLTLSPLPVVAQGQRDGASAWKQALDTRQQFENEPAGQHTRAEYRNVMDRFRAIYHGDPASLYAPRAVNAVAELLAEQGDELHDSKSVRDAAGQYQFLAKSYPQSSLAAPARVKAEGLLSLNGASDLASTTRHPRSAREESAQASVAAPGREAMSPVQPSSLAEVVENQRYVAGAAPALVTGIRHWSTSSYTRVAIDLGGEVEFQAARVEHPDRIFFDLHGAKLAPGLVGKTFNITDDGFLKTVRAGQFGADVTRIVLDVQPVAEYSAFLLPNPTRLIIDVHGKPQGEGRAEVARSGALPEDVVSAAAPGPASDSGSAKAPTALGSALPPMPVTDGSVGFGLPARRAANTAAVTPVAQPRVVVSSKPTAGRPVTNAVATPAPGTTREVAAVSEGPGVIAATPSPGSQPVVDRIKDARSLSSRREEPAANPDEAATSAVPPPPTASGQSTLMRALGLKIGRIVIDAGHGGHDSGTLGVGGIEEKDVVLDVALRLGKLLHDRLGAEIVYTRADDTFIPLETRTAIANKAQADLFISIHANSSGDPSARGVEVYYLNFTSDPEAMQVAGRENAVSSQRVNQLSDLVKKIALKDKIDESRELATDVDSSLYSGLHKGNEGLRDRGVKKAPFVVLIGANMPSILAEISFVTNPGDADELGRPSYRERVAESLYNGVARYAGAINGAPASGRKANHTERAALKQTSGGEKN